jgi:DNA-directed RNA polymerase subunit RPC12/RpoP
MTNIERLLSRTISIFKAHVLYSQNLATEFSLIVQEYDNLLKSEAINEEIDQVGLKHIDQTLKVEKAVEDFEQLIKKEPIERLWLLETNRATVKNDSRTNIIWDSRLKRFRRSSKRIIKNKALSEEVNIKQGKLSPKKCAGEKSCKCDICGENFSTKGNLKTHMRNHSGEKPYECPECFKRFKQLSNLRQHARNHSGEKPYKCANCSKRFKQLSNLNQHVYNKHS